VLRLANMGSRNAVDPELDYRILKENFENLKLLYSTLELKLKEEKAKNVGLQNQLSGKLQDKAKPRGSNVFSDIRGWINKSGGNDDVSFDTQSVVELPNQDQKNISQLEIENSELQRDKSYLEATIADLKLNNQNDENAKFELQRKYASLLDQINLIAQVVNSGIRNLKSGEQTLYPYLSSIRDAITDLANSEDTPQSLKIDQAEKEIDQRKESFEEERKEKKENVMAEYNKLAEEMKTKQVNMDLIIFEPFMAKAKDLIMISPSGKDSERFPEFAAAEILINAVRELMSKKMIVRRLFTLREAGYTDTVNIQAQ
jgi:hypothetical protein